MALTRLGAMAWTVVLSFPFQLVFEVAGLSATSCTVKTKGGRVGSGHFDTFGTFTVRSVDAIDRIYADELAAWPARREQLTWYASKRPANRST